MLFLQQKIILIKHSCASTLILQEIDTDKVAQAYTYPSFSTSIFQHEDSFNKRFQELLIRKEQMRNVHDDHEYIDMQENEQIDAELEYITSELQKIEQFKAQLSHASTLDIGGVRKSCGICSIYRLAGSDAITVNCDVNAMPNFIINNGLDFKELLETFPELRLMGTNRPVNCFIGHVGLNIFSDFLRKIDDDFCLFNASWSKEALIYNILDFIESFSHFLMIFRGGTFTYESNKNPIKDLVGNRYLKCLISPLQMINIQDYICINKETNEEIQMPHCEIQRGYTTSFYESVFEQIIKEVFNIHEFTSVTRLLYAYSTYFHVHFLVPVDFSLEGVSERAQLLQAKLLDELSTSPETL
jgi:hypothetical protein